MDPGWPHLGSASNARKPGEWPGSQSDVAWAASGTNRDEAGHSAAHDRGSVMREQTRCVSTLAQRCACARCRCSCVRHPAAALGLVAAAAFIALETLVLSAVAPELSLGVV